MSFNPCAEVKNIGTELVARFIDGIAGSAFLSVGGGTGGELCLSAMSCWTFYLLIIWAFVTLVLIAVFIPETYNPVIVRHKATKIGKTTRDERWKAPIEIMEQSFSRLVIRSIYRSFLLLMRDPMCLNLCLFSVLLLGVLYLFFGAFEIVFRDNHGFELWQIGLTFSNLLVGQLLAISTDPFWHKNYLRLARKKGRKRRGA